MELFVYKGLQELPSVDFNCLRTMAYAKLAKVPIKINSDGNPFMSPNGFLPYMIADGRKYCGYDGIIEELKQRGYNLSSSPEMSNGLSDAYKYYLMKNIYPSMQYFVWGDPQNNDNTRGIYARRTRFPLNFFYPQKYIKETERLIELLQNFSIDDKPENHDTASLLFKAKNSLNLISTKLNDRETLFTTYTEADANLYALLAILYHIPLQNNPLKSHINESPFLVKYVDRFRRKFLADSEVLNCNSDYSKSKTGLVEMDDERYYSQKMPKILAFVFATLAMSGFAIRQGIFHLSRDPIEVLHEVEYEDNDEL